MKRSDCPFSGMNSTAFLVRWWEGLFSPADIFLSGPWAGANGDRCNFRVARETTRILTTLSSS